MTRRPRRRRRRLRRQRAKGRHDRSALTKPPTQTLPHSYGDARRKVPAEKMLLSAPQISQGEGATREGREGKSGRGSLREEGEVEESRGK